MHQTDFWIEALQGVAPRWTEQTLLSVHCHTSCPSLVPAFGLARLHGQLLCMRAGGCAMLACHRSLHRLLSCPYPNRWGLVQTSMSAQAASRLLMASTSGIQGNASISHLACCSGVATCMAGNLL